MSGLASTIAQLKAMRVGEGFELPAGAGVLTPFDGFGANPGALIATTFVPDDLAPGAALVVVLHGCTQTAEGYDRGSGWSRLAEEQGFALLYPEQTRANNANLCFNWFERGDIARGQGEALSILQMIEAMIATHDLDPARVFVTGLSAGGAMAAVMLAAYPEIFAGGAIIAGLPYGFANGVQGALGQMRRAGGGDGAAMVRAASTHAGPWPTISIWHGSADRTVDASNAAALLEQWRPLHGVGKAPADRETIGGHVREVWRDEAGREVIESYTIAGMGHGTPLATSGPDACGAPGPHMLDAGLSSTRRIARFWGLETRAMRSDPRPAKVAPLAPAAAPPLAAGPGKVIEDALRAAGLMR